jgi:hypothetical protein
VATKRIDILFGDEKIKKDERRHTTTYVVPDAMAASKSADVRLLEAADASAVWKDEHAAMAKAAESMPRTNIRVYICRE